MRVEVARVVVYVDIGTEDSSATAEFQVEVKANKLIDPLGIEHSVMAAAASFVKVFSEGRELARTRTDSKRRSPEMEEVLDELRTKAEWPSVISTEENKQ